MTFTALPAALSSLPGPSVDVQGTREQQREELTSIARYRRLVNYLAAAQVYLKDNVLLQEPLRPEHIKDRLLGHWGTCPGINLVYAHLNRLICHYDLDMFLVTGPGHGAPANLANLYLEGTLQEYYPHLTLDRSGLHEFIQGFSWPGGFPSHLYPGVPGTIHEGGELGYALATAFGAAFDNPDLIVACIVGDGEAETGPTAAAWHSYKFLDPQESGAVLPILHLNGYKISNPTIYGTMSDVELVYLFTGYGWQVRLVADSDLDADLYASLDWAYREIRSIQRCAREGKPLLQPRWPLIILRSPKGMSGIGWLDGRPMEGSYRSHQVPAKDLKTNPEHLKLVESWLRSYRIDELLDEAGHPDTQLLALCPQGNRRMGSNPHTFGGRIRKPLDLPSIAAFAVPVIPVGQEPICQRGETQMSSVQAVTQYIKEVICRNRQTFRIFCPDELESNLLGSVLEVTGRNYQWPVPPFNEHITADDGRVLEILSEHTCQGWLQGYLLTGRHGLFPSYEAFLNIVTSMMDQYAKFLKMSQEFPWRLPVASLNYLETSTLWRQEHNGFSHQSPGFINSVLNKKAGVMRVYLPPDANCLISTVDHCLRSKNYVNLVIANKQPAPQWLTMDEAVHHCRAGASVWPWASTDAGVDPDVVLVGIGDNSTLEVLAAAHTLRNEFPQLRLRVVNVTDLLVLEEETEHPHGLNHDLFNALFTPDRPVIINFHGYPSVVMQLLFHRPNQERFFIHGYREEGTTTTPFDMNVRNGTSRYHLINQAIRLAAAHNPYVAARASERVSHYTYILRDHRRYIHKHGCDPEEITHWRWC
ncbi:phosphoketolase family protein [Anthocerotibacter panamensis]|uniref:phosphoketolase family protein n=1 Tax=Anthocerotibacter panamensis TaxID=2857077 RepID=UPI001C402EBB|nr:phosphoketolase family protein [Anthocerotibacter panamensis]